MYADLTLTNSNNRGCFQIGATDVCERDESRNAGITSVDHSLDSFPSRFVAACMETFRPWLISVIHVKVNIKVAQSALVSPLCSR